MEKTRIGVLVGSARRESYSGKIAKNLLRLLPERFDAQFLALADLPIYNQDFDDDGNVPPEWAAFRAKVREMDAYLFVTPEYNRSVPPLLKNALDVASRPFGKNNWGGKPGAIISVSPGKQGAFGANHHLRQSMTFLDIFMMQQPEAYIGGAVDMLDEAGVIRDESALKFLRMVADDYVAWVDRFVTPVAKGTI